jgi:hypothetical protein
MFLRLLLLLRALHRRRKRTRSIPLRVKNANLMTGTRSALERKRRHLWRSMCMYRNMLPDQRNVVGRAVIQMRTKMYLQSNLLA